MREIEHAHHAEDQRQPRGQHEQQQPVGHAVQQRDDEEFHGGKTKDGGPSRRPCVRASARAITCGRCILQDVGCVDDVGRRARASVLKPSRCSPASYLTSLPFDLDPRRDEQRLQQLVVGLAHLDLADVRLCTFMPSSAAATFTGSVRLGLLRTPRRASRSPVSIAMVVVVVRCTSSLKPVDEVGVDDLVGSCSRASR